MDLEKKMLLQQNYKGNGLTQAWVTVPKDFLQMFGWKKGDKLILKAVTGSGMITIEKDD